MTVETPPGGRALSNRRAPDENLAIARPGPLPLIQCPLNMEEVGLRSMHLAVPGAVAHLFHIQRALNQGGVDQAWLSPDFHQELADWKVLALQAASQPTHLAEIIC